MSFSSKLLKLHILFNPLVGLSFPEHIFECLRDGILLGDAPGARLDIF